ncbi:hypothetical protein [Streptomyces meridianus]|uniref:Lipoprotein n=1 Tax=Streptomyces meridianus TaxID=2938945 RepID=A0ABT0X471_9ACTN|nr:hypothetical protein [Streptomyces meridianus]MCM2577341.1 hypothetical protein [Streptomyces meridianus]
MAEHQYVGRRRAVAVAVAGALIVGGAGSGCAGRGAVADDRPAAARVAPAVSLAEVRRAADVLIRSRSSLAGTSIETVVGGTRVVIRGRGAFDYVRRLGRLRVVLPRDAAGDAGHRPITELLAPGALYMKNRGAGVPADKWVRVDTGHLSDGNLLTGGATDPLSAAQLLRGAGSVSYVGRDRVLGVGVRHVRGTASIARAAQASEDGRGALTSAAKGFSTDTVRFDAWFDADGRLRKVRHRFQFSPAPGAPRQAAEVVSTVLLYDFGAAVEVDLPDEADIYTGRIAVPEG